MTRHRVAAKSARRHRGCFGAGAWENGCPDRWRQLVRSRKARRSCWPPISTDEHGSESWVIGVHRSLSAAHRLDPCSPPALTVDFLHAGFVYCLPVAAGRDGLVCAGSGSVWRPVLWTIDPEAPGAFVPADSAAARAALSEPQSAIPFQRACGAEAGGDFALRGSTAGDEGPAGDRPIAGASGSSAGRGRPHRSEASGSGLRGSVKLAQAPSETLSLLFYLNLRWTNPVGRTQSE